MKTPGLPEGKDRSPTDVSSSRRKFVGLLAGTAGITVAPAFC